MSVPTDFAGLTCWLKADVGTFQDTGTSTPAGVGDPVGHWADQSGGTSEWTQGTAGQRPTVVLAVDGKAGVRFDGIDDRLTGPALSVLMNADTYTMLVVATVHTISTDNANRYQNAAILTDNDSVYFGIMLRSGLTIPPGPTVQSLNYDGAYKGESRLIVYDERTALYVRHGGGTLYVGTIFTSETSVASGSTGGLTGLTRMGIGYGPAFADMDVHEVITYDTLLGTSDVAALYDYLDARWALLSVLAGTTRDATGAALPGATVKVFRTADDTLADTGVSDGSGAFSFPLAASTEYYLVAYLAGSPDLAGTSLNTLTAS